MTRINLFKVRLRFDNRRGSTANAVVVKTTKKSSKHTVNISFMTKDITGGYNVQKKLGKRLAFLTQTNM